MVGQSQTEEKPLKTGVLEKRSQNLSFVTMENYNTRLFVLVERYLKYFSGGHNNRELKGSVDLRTALVIENVADDSLEGKCNIFQVVYTYGLDGDPVSLYMIAPSSNSRDSWVSAIRLEAQRSGAIMLSKYHDGVWQDKDSIYTCCKHRHREAVGCKQSSQAARATNERPPSPAMSMMSMGSGHNFRLSNLMVDNMLKRARGRSAFFTKENYKRRTFVLDANSLRYYQGDIRVKKNEKGRVHLSCVVTVEPAEDAEQNHENMFQVAYFDEYDLLRLYVVANTKHDRDLWVKAIKRECINMGAEFLSTYHPGMWDKKAGKWRCCDVDVKENEGCRRVIAMPEMKFCGAEMNNSLNQSVVSQSQHKGTSLVKVSSMLKRSQNKSTFFSSNNYQERVFMLDTVCLAFYTGYADEGGELKGWIPFVDMVVVESVRDGLLEDKLNAFQVAYYEDGALYHLYIVANTDHERLAWIAAIKREVARSRVSLARRYHDGVWLKKTRQYNCCMRVDREALGCVEVMGMSLTSVRDRTNTMDSNVMVTRA